MTRLISILTSLTVLGISLGGCTPRFNREKLNPSKPLSKLNRPLLDLTAEGGSAAIGVTSHFRVSRVAIAGNIQRIQAQTASGAYVQGGLTAPR